jgi:3-phenylpropionate/cinnamic acid dioxygenase small subunit
MTSLQAGTIQGIQAHRPERFIPVGPGVYHDIQHFLFREAYLLDHGRYSEWAGLLAEDLVYRTAVQVPNGFAENYRSIRERIGHLPEAAAGAGPAEQPRRWVTNIIVSVAGCCDEYDVVSYLLITRSRAGEAEKLLSAERHDRLRRSSQSYRLVQREIILDPGARAMPDFL